MSLLHFRVSGLVSAAPFLYDTFLTVRGTGCAHISTVEQQIMMSISTLFRGNVPCQIFLHSFNIRSVRQTDASRNSEDMSVDCNYGLSVDYRGDDVRSFPPNSGQFHQIFSIRWHLASEVADYHFRELDQMMCLAVGIGYGMYSFEHLLKRCH